MVKLGLASLKYLFECPATNVRTLVYGMSLRKYVFSVILVLLILLTVSISFFSVLVCICADHHPPGDNHEGMDTRFETVVALLTLISASLLLRYY